MFRLLTALLFLICVVLPARAWSDEPQDAPKDVVSLYTQAGVNALRRLKAENEANTRRGESHKNRYIFTFEEAHSQLKKAEDLPLGETNAKFLKEISREQQFKRLLGELEGQLNAELIKLNDSLPAQAPKVYVGLDGLLGEIILRQDLKTSLPPQGLTLANIRELLAAPKQKARVDVVNNNWTSIFTNISTDASLTQSQDGMEIISMGIFHEYFSADENGQNASFVREWCLSNFNYAGTADLRPTYFDNIYPSVIDGGRFRRWPRHLYDKNTLGLFYDSKEIFEVLKSFSNRIARALKGDVDVLNCAVFPNALPGNKVITDYTNPKDLLNLLLKLREGCFSKLSVEQRIHILKVINQAGFVSDNSAFKEFFLRRFIDGFGGENAALAVVNTVPAEQIDQFLNRFEQENLHISLSQAIDDKAILVGQENYRLFMRALTRLVLSSPTFVQRISELEANLAERSYTWDRSYAFDLASAPIGTHKYSVSLSTSTGEVLVTDQRVVRPAELDALPNGVLILKPAQWSQPEPRTHRPFDLLLFIDQSGLGLTEQPDQGTALIPAIFLKFADQKKWNEDLLKGTALAFDFATIAAGPGAVNAALRATTTLAKVTRTAWAITEVAGAVGNIYVNNLQGSEYAEVVNNYNLIMATIGIKNLARGTVLSSSTSFQIIKNGNYSRIKADLVDRFVNSYRIVEDNLTNLSKLGNSDAKAIQTLKLLISKLSIRNVYNLVDDFELENIQKSIKYLPGPQLPIDVSSTFEGLSYFNRKLTSNERYFKYHGKSNRTGKRYTYFTKTKYSSERELREGLAIRDDWGVKIEFVSEFDVPAGTWVSEGKAAAQGEGYPGQDYQAVILKVANTWVVKTEKAF